MHDQGEGGGDGLLRLLDGLTRLLVYGGALAVLIGLGMLLTTYFQGQGVDASAVQRNVNNFSPILLFGGIACAAGIAWMMWSEETAGPLLLIVGAALYFAPVYMPMIGQGAEAALAPIATGGIPFAIAGLVVIIFDVISRLRTRVKVGAKADQLKFGKGIKEERDVRNVFLGKCWQLPYCRKFVRERCPIFHAKRCCWKERVGCMCEEAVIRNAMGGQTIPKDAVAAAKMIPYNNKLTAGQKAERCRQCVIYNEHQKHKYQLLVPVAIVGILGGTVALWVPLGRALQNGLVAMDNAFKSATFASDQELVGQTEGAADATAITGGSIPYHYILLVVISLVAVAYAIKLIEYAIFKLKI